MLDDATFLTVVGGAALLCSLALFALVIETVRMWRLETNLRR
jgi:hypothetical protein